MGEVYKKADIDEMIEILNEAEDHIKDAEWVKDQKKKFQFQQDIALRMQKLQSQKTSQTSKKESTSLKMKESMALGILRQLAERHNK